jgi:hypothetical protein
MTEHGQECGRELVANLFAVGSLYTSDKALAQLCAEELLGKAQFGRNTRCPTFFQDRTLTLTYLTIRYKSEGAAKSKTLPAKESLRPRKSSAKKLQGAAEEFHGFRHGSAGCGGMAFASDVSQIAPSRYVRRFLVRLSYKGRQKEGAPRVRAPLKVSVSTAASDLGSKC